MPALLKAEDPPYYIIVDPENEMAEVNVLEHGQFNLKLSALYDSYEFGADGSSFSISFSETWDE